ncbi:hypothetical protein LCI18_012636 [Fusarium solani-melongenae]|uniref:Uncharacterized protein n=1 Tax=Fusarium solani subsp. cucurbitae TaxID=2747967 RepID=A0ACD3ZKR1_FUSSC|nr:hypothetical protein LCI18_012636 [Fusarium solani-melongenae]
MPYTKVDPAIIEALGLDPACSSIASHGGSGFASTFKISTTVDGKPVNYFVKTGPGKEAEVMFRGEHASLNAIADTVPNFCPRSHAHGALANREGHFFLVTDFLDLGSSAPGGTGRTFAAKLAELHTTPAPKPEGHDKPMFGFHVPTCCGSTEQDNSWKESWADFYAENRLRHIKREAVRNHGPDPEFERLIEKVASNVVPRLIGDDRVKNIKPVVIHGDLWNGNYSRGQIAGKGGCEEVVYDPAVVYGHSEYELGIMIMFGGFTPHFWREYRRLVPPAEPVEEWEDRLRLYELYHHLNHYAMFGGGYRSGATSMMKGLIHKFGSGEQSSKKD